MTGGNGGNGGGNGKQVNLEIDDETSKGIYANLAILSHTETEFVIDFAFIFPAQPKNKVKARIISSPLHTKRFLKALEENLKKYEEKFGEIKG
jgi:hypothetical protein